MLFNASNLFSAAKILFNLEYVNEKVCKVWLSESPKNMPYVFERGLRKKKFMNRVDVFY